MKRKLMMMAMVLVLACSAQATLKGLWEFEDAMNLTAASVGADLELNGTGQAATAGVDAADGAVTVQKGTYYKAYAGIAANGGGSWVNEFSLLFDVKYDADVAGSWKALFNTSNTNSNDSDYFIKNSDQSWGVAAIGYTNGSTASVLDADGNPNAEFKSSPDTWYRAVITADLASSGGFMKLYIDGVHVATHTVGVNLDGRMSLYSGDVATLILLGDNDGDDAEIHCSTMAIWDTTLDDAAVSALGTAGAVVPEPATMALLGFGGLALIRRKK